MIECNSVYISYTFFVVAIYSYANIKWYKWNKLYWYHLWWDVLFLFLLKCLCHFIHAKHELSCGQVTQYHMGVPFRIRNVLYTSINTFNIQNWPSTFTVQNYLSQISLPYMSILKCIDLCFRSETRSAVLCNNKPTN